MSERARDRLVLGLDVSTYDEAIGLAERLQPWFAVAKVGLELFTAAGPRIVEALRDAGYDVFADLKYHDIPTTVGRAARVAGRLGVKYLNFHAAGGLPMVRAGADGLREGAADGGHREPVPLAVTVLTSDPDASAFDARLATAVEAGCGGVVCSALEVASVKDRHPGLTTVVPGTRPAGSDPHDQARTATPGEAARAGADLLVMARVVVADDDPEAAAGAVTEEVEGALRDLSGAG